MKAGPRVNPEAAAVITVQNNGDTGPGSLRAAIISAAPGDTIDFGPAVLSTGSIPLTSGELLIDKDLTIQGPGSGHLTIRRANGTGDFRVFNITSGANVTFEGLTITNGRAVDSTGTTPEKDSGGGINVLNGNLSLTDCVITANFATNSGGGIEILSSTLTIYESTISENLASLGGGINAYGGSTLTITDSTISENSAGNTAAIELEDTTATLSNCTISDNLSTSGGGAVNNVAAGGQVSSMTLVNCTVANNQNHGVLTVDNGGGSARTTLKNTIFDNNGENFKKIGTGIAITSLGNNLDSDGTSGFANGVNGDIVGAVALPVDAGLGELADNGGPTKTIALLYGSPAIDAGDDTAALASDQRGLSRTGTGSDGNGDGSGASDMGAFEVQKYLVVNTSDSGLGSLREAVTDNNINGGGLIAFEISGTGIHTIAPASGLPLITKTVTIDGYTQPGSRPNGSSVINDAILLIELSGANTVTIAEGLNLFGSHCTVRGLVINGFTNGILIKGPYPIGSCNRIIGNFIGSDATGMSSVPNSYAGVNIGEGSINNLIGYDINSIDEGDRNLISGNSDLGVFIQSVGTYGNTVQGNFIGLAADGISDLGNAAGSINPGFGVVIGFGAEGTIVQDNRIEFNASAGLIIYTDNSTQSPINNSIGNNIIASNAGCGVVIATDNATSAPVGNFLYGNRIYSNGGLGIDLGFDGVTPNDTGDSDAGPNNLQNYPVINSVTATGISGTLNSTPNSMFRVEFYANSICDPSGNGQGEVFLGALDSANAVVTDGSGNAVFNFSFASVPGKSYITATATNIATRDTSEFSACVSALSPVPPPTLSQVSVLDDLIIATGTGFVAPVQVLIDGVGFIDPAIVESDGSGVRQAGILYNGKTIAESVVPGKMVQIEIINSGGASSTYSYTPGRSVSYRGLQRRPPIVLTNVYFSGTSVTIEGALSGLVPNTEYVVYFFYTPSGESTATAISCPDVKDPKTIMLSPPIKVKTDNFGNSKPFKQVYPAVGGKGFVNAIAVPASGPPIKLTSNCIGAKEPPGPTLFEIKVELDPQQPDKDRIVIDGFGFTETTRVSLNDVDFADRASVKPSPVTGEQLIQSGRLADGRAIRQVIKPGITVSLTVRNGDGGSTRVFFRN